MAGRESLMPGDCAIIKLTLSAAGLATNSHSHSSTRLRVLHADSSLHDSREEPFMMAIGVQIQSNLSVKFPLLSIRPQQSCDHHAML